MPGSWVPPRHTYLQYSTYNSAVHDYQRKWRQKKDERLSVTAAANGDLLLTGSQLEVAVCAPCIVQGSLFHRDKPFVTALRTQSDSSFPAGHFRDRERSQ